MKVIINGEFDNIPECYIIKKETKCFYEINNHELDVIVDFDLSIKIYQIGKLIDTKKIKKDKVNVNKFIEMEEIDYLFNSYYSKCVKKLDYTNDKHNILLQFLNNPEKDRLFKFFNILVQNLIDKNKHNKKVIEPETKTEIKKEHEYFKGYDYSKIFGNNILELLEDSNKRDIIPIEFFLQF